ncbi:hypothetical protein NOX69_005036 [Pseudomonas aeruginosa]|nr:hypothetical protein [Pseudomonas aeruginosa]
MSLAFSLKAHSNRSPLVARFAQAFAGHRPGERLQIVMDTPGAVRVAGDVHQHPPAVLAEQPTIRRASVAASLKRALMADMLVDAYKARYHHKVLSASELQLIIGLCRDGVVGKLDGDLVKPRQLRLLGHAVTEPPP